MAEIIPLKRPTPAAETVEAPTPLKDIIFKCGCGCITFEIRADQVFECAACGEIFTEDGHWVVPYLKNAGIAEKSDGTDTFTVAHSDNKESSEFSKRLIERKTQQEDTNWVMCGQKDGSVAAWIGVPKPTDEQLAWFKARAEVGVKLLLGKPLENDDESV